MGSIDNKGCFLEFHSLPPCHPPPMMGTQCSEFLTQEVPSLLRKGEITKVSPSSNLSIFYSEIFAISNKGGGQKPILDLRALNNFLYVSIFRVLSLHEILPLLSPGLWFHPASASISLQKISAFHLWQYCLFYLFIFIVLFVSHFAGHAGSRQLTGLKYHRTIQS